jgi:hypothetical protein
MGTFRQNKKKAHWKMLIFSIVSDSSAKKIRCAREEPAKLSGFTRINQGVNFNPKE